MRKEFPLGELLMILAIIGILATLMIQNVSTNVKKGDLSKELQESLQSLSNIVSSTEQYISKSDIPEEDKKQILNHVASLEKEVISMPSPESIGDIKTQIAAVEFALNDVKLPDTLIKKASSKDPDLTISPLQTVEARLAKLEAKLDVFMQERLTKWDVCTVVFIVLGGLGGIIILLKLSFLESSKRNIKRRKI